MKPKVIFIERKPSDSVSIERVFRQIVNDFPIDQFDVEFQSVPYGNGILAIIKNLIFFHKRPADIYHITGDIHYISLLTPANRTVLTIHDLIFLRRQTGLRRFVLRKLFLNFPVRRIKQITAVSQTIKDEIILRSRVPEVNIEVIQNPLIDGFSAQPEKAFDQDFPVILHIGTAENKNLPTLIEAVEGLCCKLIIIGHLSDKVIESLRRRKISYENETGLNESDIIEQYRKADIVSFCSTYEGFGLPIIEAQAMRKPVITSDLPPMNEIAGPHGVLVNPYNSASIKNALVRIISDSEYRTRIVDAGEENVKRFTGKSAAGKYVQIYERMLAEIDRAI